LCSIEPNARSKIEHEHAQFFGYTSRECRNPCAFGLKWREYQSLAKSAYSGLGKAAHLQDRLHQK
jgi:hypothetical protein